MIGPVAKQLGVSLRAEPQKWYKTHCCTIQHCETNFVIWVGNGYWSISPYEMRAKNFNPIEKALILYSLVRGGVASPWTLATLPFQIFIGLPGGIFIQEDKVIRAGKKQKLMEQELETSIALGGTEQFRKALLETLEHMPKAEALTSPNPVIRYYARQKWKNNGSKQK